MTLEAGGGKQAAFEFIVNSVEIVDPDTGATYTVPADQVALGGPAQGAESSAKRPQRGSYSGTEAAADPGVYKDSKSPT